MKWFKCPSPNNPVILHAESVIGKIGVWESLKVVAEAMEQEVSVINVEIIAKWANVKRDRAEKIYPECLKIYQESQEISGKSQEISGKSQEISGKSQDLTPSNTDGSTRDQERIEEKEESRIEREEHAPTLFSGQTKKGYRLPEEWDPSENTIEWAKSKWPNINLVEELEAFKDYWLGVPGAKGTKLDWDGTFKNNLRRVMDRKTPPWQQPPKPEYDPFAGAI